MNLFPKLKSISILAWSKTRPRYKAHTRGGKISLPADHPETRGLVYWSPGWKADLIAKVLARRPGVFVDVGANIGQTLLDYQMSQNRYGYLGFEPNLKCADHVQSLIQANRIPNAALLPVGLSAENSVMKFYSSSSSDSCATTVADLRPTRTEAVSIVPCFRFDDLEPKLIEDRISLIKIDVEGGELGVLLGMRAALEKHQPWVICEVLRRDRFADPKRYEKRCTDLWDVIRSVGYQVWNIRKSPDGKQVTGFVSVECFPNEVFEPHHYEECDYLFAPAGTQVSSILTA